MSGGRGREPPGPVVGGERGEAGGAEQVAVGVQHGFVQPGHDVAVVDAVAGRGADGVASDAGQRGGIGSGAARVADDQRPLWSSMANTS